MPTFCPRCGHQSTAAVRFCPECGNNLQETHPIRERRSATALFADLVGYTSLTESNDPEVVRRDLDRAFAALANAVEKHGGVVESFLGDALFALFGVPLAREDDPTRAVRCALEMQAEADVINRDLLSKQRRELRFRIGIETGEVLVGGAASGRSERAVTGDAVNTAARLQSAAEPGTVLVGPNAQALTSGTIEYGTPKHLELKGKKEPVLARVATRVHAPAPGAGSIDADGPPLVGRDEELARIGDAFEEVRTSGRPAGVTIVGDAGIGKSRLAAEAVRHLQQTIPQVVVRLGRCPRYAGAPYSALAEVMKAQCGISEADSADETSAKLERAVQQLTGDRSLIPPLLALVGGAGDGAVSSRELLFLGWGRFLEAIARSQPLVLAIEDLHWADDGLLEFLEYLLDWGEAPILVIGTARKELADRAEATRLLKIQAAITLSPLSPAATKAMLADLAPALFGEAQRVVIERGEGNPLYIREIVRMLAQRREEEGVAFVDQIAALDETAIPGSLRQLIAARLDTLSPEERSLIHNAAIIGRTFWLNAVARLEGSSTSRVLGLLQPLQEKEILTREPSSETEAEFGHALIRDVAYESLPKAARADKHAAFAEWAEERSEQGEGTPELIATHYQRALSYLEELDQHGYERTSLEQKTFEWAKLAAARAAEMWLMTSACRWYRAAVELAEVVGASKEDVAEVCENFVSCAANLAPVAELVETGERAMTIYSELGRGVDAARVEAMIAQADVASGNQDRGLLRFDRAEEHLQSFGDTLELARVLLGKVHFLWRLGDRVRAESVARRAAAIAERLGAPRELAIAFEALGLILSDRTEALTHLERSHAIATELADGSLLPRVCNNLAYVLGRFRPADERILALLAEGLQYSRASGELRVVAMLLNTRAWILEGRGELRQAEPDAAASVEHIRPLGRRSLLGEHLCDLISIVLKSGDIARAEPMFAEANSLLRDDPEPGSSMRLAILDAMFAQSRGDPRDALQRLNTAVTAVAPNTSPDVFERLLSDALVLAAHEGQADAAVRFRERLLATAPEQPSVDALASWADALLAPAGERPGQLARAADELKACGRQIDYGRSLVDLGSARLALGSEGRELIQEGRRVLERCGAHFYL